MKEKHSLQTPTQFFETIKKCYQKACAQCGSTPRYCFDIGRERIELLFAGEHLCSGMTRSLNYLSVEDSGSPNDLTVYLFDSVSTGIELPMPPWDLGDFHGRLIHYSDEDIHSFYHRESAALMMLNSKTQEAIYWIQDVQHLHFHEKCFPLRTILHWWFLRRGKQVVHAAAIGNQHKGILLPGKSGSGKSITALLSTKWGLRCVGDDFVLIGVDPPRAYGLSSMVKVDDGGHRILKQEMPELEFLDNQEYEKYGKYIFYFHEQSSERMAQEVPLCAVFVPHVNPDQKHSQLIEISPFQSLMQIAPSTVIPLAGAHQEDLSNLSELVKKVPNYSLQIGHDRDQLAELIMKFFNG